MSLTIEEISDRLLIEDLYSRYVHYADSSDIDGLDQIFESTTVLDYSSAGAGTATWEQARDTPLIRGEIFWRVHHLYTNILIDFAPDQVTATTSVKVFCPSATASGQLPGTVIELLGTYSDLLVRSDGQWKFRRRKWTPMWTSVGQTVQTEIDLDIEHKGITS